MFTFNRNEQLVLLLLSVALLAGIVVSYLDRTNSDAVQDFDVKKSAVPVPDIQEAPHPKPLSPININTGTVKDFEKLPGIGPQIAQRIVDYRNQAGNFTQLKDLTKVSGIGPKTLERLRPQLTLKTP